ncbi:hypothetical protein GDO81_017282 [Engystomops pustulosus]|uniref:Secreted phosphoprotein 24 n=1 Tax=Engystomops pustulosus TaxID=76066 RepID=A0AAV7AIJ4_ENGPU|nr:hypothetical protein GDO81_017282 [Engystomops pustulosus]
MRMMLLSVLMLMAFSCCSGKPTYNPRSREDIVTTALDATIDQLNSQSWGKNLLRLSRTGEIKIKPLSQVRGRKDAGDVSEVSLQFTVRETTCNKNTAIDLSECEFQAGQQMVSVKGVTGFRQIFFASTVHHNLVILNGK